MEEKEVKETFQDFKNKTLHREIKRNFKATNSYTTYDIYKHIRKNKWYDIGKPITEHDFYLIIRTVNKLLSERLLKGKMITFPYKMGSIELRKVKRGVRINNGKLVISYPIDWNSTLRLWYKDNEAKKQKVLIRYENNIIYKVVYDRSKAYYSNKGFIKFSLHGKLKKMLKEGICSGEIDSLYEDY